MSDEPIKRAVEETVLDSIYVALYDAYERLQNGKLNIKRCLNYLEDVHGYKPSKGYPLTKEDA
jgi:hypothetical protein